MKKIKKKYGQEEIISRIPSHFPYLEFNEFGISELHRSSDSNYGSYAQIMDGIRLDIEEDVYTGVITFLPYQYISLSDDNLIIDAYSYNQLSERSLSDYRVNKYVNLSDVKYAYAEADYDDGYEGYECYYYAKNVKNYYSGENSNEVEYYPAIIEYWQYRAKHEPNGDINGGIGRFNRRRYNPFLYCTVISADLYNIDETYQTDEWVGFFYKHNLTNKEIDKHTFDGLTEEEQGEYSVSQYANLTDIITDKEYNDVDLLIQLSYFPLYYVSDEIINIDEWYDLSDDEKQEYEKFKFANIISKEEYDNLSEEDCQTYQYVPYSFNREENIIFVKQYSVLTEMAKDDFEIYSYISSDGDVFLKQKYESIVENSTSEGAIYKKINDTEPLQFSKLILKRQEFYSYRTIMKYYYEFKEELGEKNPFIIFVNEAIGKWPIDRAVNYYNDNYTLYYKVVDGDGSEYIDSTFVKEPLEYVLTDVTTEQSEDVVPFLYKKDDSIITIDVFKELPKKDRIGFNVCGYIKKYYIDEVIFDTEVCEYVREYSEEIEGGSVFSYMKKFGDLDLDETITFWEYEDINSDGYGISSYEKVYVNNNVVINEEQYESLSTEEQSEYHLMYRNIMLSSEDEGYLITPEEYAMLPLNGKSEFSPMTYYKADDNGEPLELINEVEYWDLDENAKTQYGMWTNRAATETVYINEGEYANLSLYDRDSYTPYTYSDGDVEISAEAYENLPSFQKINYTPKTYCEIDDPTIIIGMNEFYSITLLGKNNYVIYKTKIISPTEIDGFTSTKIEFKKEQDLVPSSIYLAGAAALYDKMTKTSKICWKYFNGIATSKQLCCMCDEYYRMGGDAFVELLSKLIDKSKEIAEYYYNLSEKKYFKESGEQGIRKNSFNLSISLIDVSRESGYLTPYMDFWNEGETLENGTIFNYEDEDGNIQTYVTKPKQGEEYDSNIGIYDPITEKISLDYRRVKLRNSSQSVIQNVTISNGVAESRLKSLRRYETYTDMYGNVLYPDKYTDWLFYYRKGYVSHIDRIINTETGEIGTNDGTDNYRYFPGTELVSNLDAYGNVLVDITADKVNNTITFVYKIDGHLTIRVYDLIVDYKQKGYSNEYITIEEYNGLTEEERQQYEQLEEPKTIHCYSGQYMLDTSEFGEKCGTLYTETYEYTVDGDLYNLVNDETKYKYEDEPTEDGYYERFISVEEYNELIPHEKTKYRYIDGWYVKLITTEQYDRLPTKTFEEYINGNEEEETNETSDSEQMILYEPNNKYEFVIDKTTYEKRIGYNFSDIPIKLSHYTNIHETNTNGLDSPLLKEEYLSNIHFKPSVTVDVEFNRGSNAAFERHLRLSEVKTLEDMENYRNGSFFNIQNYLEN